MEALSIFVLIKNGHLVGTIKVYAGINIYAIELGYIVVWNVTPVSW